MDDDFDWSQFDDIDSDVDALGVLNVTTLETMELLNRFQQLTEELKDREEALRPRTQEARELHSQRAAMLIELRNRGIMR